MEKNYSHSKMWKLVPYWSRKYEGRRSKSTVQIACDWMPIRHVNYEAVISLLNSFLMKQRKILQFPKSKRSDVKISQKTDQCSQFFKILGNIFYKFWLTLTYITRTREVLWNKILGVHNYVNTFYLLKKIKI